MLPDVRVSNTDQVTEPKGVVCPVPRWWDVALHAGRKESALSGILSFLARLTASVVPLKKGKLQVIHHSK